MGATVANGCGRGQGVALACGMGCRAGNCGRKLPDSPYRMQVQRPVDARTLASRAKSITRGLTVSLFAKCAT
jgi:hypothetical protein